jgi:hypothetical protein
VSAQIAAVGRMQAIRLHDHRHRVPAHVGAQPLFDLDVARRAFFLVGGNCVDVGGIGGERQIDAGLARLIDELLQQEVRSLPAFGSDDCRQRLEPFARFLRIVVVGLSTEKRFW